MRLRSSTNSASPIETILSARVAVVTGAGRGIGRAIALRLAAAHVRVVVVARSGRELDEVAGLISEMGGRARAVPADLSSHEHVERLVADLLDRERVDILINNAAVVGPLGPTTAIEASGVIASLALNLVAPITLSSGLAPSMIDNRWGRIVNVSSAVVDHPAAMLGANSYVTSKAALEAHTINLAAELVGTGVTANVFRPGLVDTSMQTWIRNQRPDAIGSELHDQFSRSFSEGRLAAPDRPADALVARLVSEASGQIWDVNDQV